MKFAVFPTLILITSCAPVGFSETTKAVCDAWRGSLVTVSSQDTRQTREEALASSRVQEEVCQ